MKMSEMIAMLEKDPNLKFRTTNDRTRREFYCKDKYYYYDVYLTSTGELISSSLGGGGFNGNLSMKLDWELIRGPVTFMEAAQAISDGKTIMCDCNGKVNTYEPGKVSQIALNYILHGTWYIDE